MSGPQWGTGSPHQAPWAIPPKMKIPGAASATVDGLMYELTAVNAIFCLHEHERSEGIIVGTLQQCWRRR